MTIRFAGMSSGLDIDSMVKALMLAKQTPIDKMVQQKQQMQWKRDDYRSMNTLLSGLQTAANDLRWSDKLNAKKVTTNNDFAVSASATSNAAAGTTVLKVNKLAEAATLQSGAAITAASISGGTLTVNGQDITVNANSSTTDVVNAINAKSSLTGVTANYDDLTKKLNLVTAKTGQSQTITVTGSSNVLSDLQLTDGATAAGKNSEVYVNGTLLDSTRSESNTFTLNNVTYQLKQATGQDTTVIVGQDSDKIFNTIKNFVDTYNDTISKVYSKITEARHSDVLPLTDDQRKSMTDDQIKTWETNAKSGMVRGDSTLNQALDELRSDLTGLFTGGQAGAYKSLSDIGITTAPPGDKNAYLERGKLYIDEGKLRSAIASNPDQLTDLFAKSNATAAAQPAAASSTATVTASSFSGSLTINGYNITVAAGSSMDNVVKAINDQKAYTNVSAAYDSTTQKLTLSTTSTGAASSLNLSGDATLLTDLNLTAGTTYGTNRAATAPTDAGFAQRIYQSVGDVIDRVNGIAGKSYQLVDNSMLGMQISRLTNQISDDESKLPDYEQKYYTQFASLESALNKLNSQSSYLSSFSK